MKKIIVLKNLALNAGVTDINDVNSITEGALAIFTDKNVLLTVGNVVASMSDVKSIRYVTKYDGTMHWSNEIVREHASVDAQASRVAVKPIIYVGNDLATGALNLPGTLIPGTIAFIRIVKEIPIREVGLEKQRFEYVVKTGDTAATVLTAIVAQINGRSDRFVDAAVVTGNVGIKLTVRDDDTAVTVGLDGIFGNSTVIKDGTSNSIALDYGAGTFKQIQELEEFYSPSSGNTSKMYLASYYFSRQNVAITGLAYDTYTINFQRRHMSASSTEFATNQVLVVAMPKGATLQTGFETIQTAIYGLAGGNEETGNDTAV